MGGPQVRENNWRASWPRPVPVGGADCFRADVVPPKRTAQTRRLASRLAHHLLGGFVVTHAEESRMAQPAVTRPLTEADLRYEARLDPGHVRFAYVVGERRRLPAQRCELRRQL